MKKWIFEFLTLLLLLLFILNRQAHAQEVSQNDEFIPLRQVYDDFQSAKSNVRSNADTIQVYLDFIERLIRRGNYFQADSVLKNHLESFTSLNNEALLAQLFRQRAYMYKAQRRLPQALQDYLWLTEYYEKQKDLNELFEIYSLMAEYYRAYRNFDLMEVHLQLAKDIGKSTRVDLDHEAYWNSRVASWHTEYTGNYDSTQFYARKGAKQAKEASDLYTEALSLNELGFTINRNGEMYDSSMYYFKQARNLLLKSERYRDYVNIQNNIVLRLSPLDTILAIQILEKIIPLEEENNWYIPLSTSLNQAKFQYNLRGQLDKADEAMHKIYQARIDETLSDKAIAVNDLALTYANELTKKELEVQEQKTQLAESEAKNNLRAFAIAAIIASFLGVITLTVFVVNRRFRKKNELLEIRKNEIEAANYKLEKSLKHQKTLYKELNHRVKNNLTVLTGLVYLQELDETDNNLKASMAKLRSRIKSMAIAHESLYKTESNGKIQFGDYLKDLFEELKGALTQNQIILTEIDCANFELELKNAIPLAMIFNELFTNSIKHGFKGYKEGSISIQGSLVDNNIILQYKDNGSGYAADSKQNMGLSLVGLLLEQIDAKLEDKSSQTGFSVILRLPKN